MRFALRIVAGALVVIAAVLSLLVGVNVALLLLAAAVGVLVLLLFFGIRFVGTVTLGGTKVPPSEFNYTNDGATPLPPGVTGVAGGTRGAVVTSERGEAQVGFSAETPVDLFGVAEVGLSFEATLPDQVVKATLAVEHNYSGTLAPGATANVDIEIFITSTAGRTIRKSIVSIAPMGPISFNEQSMNPAVAAGATPEPPLDAVTLGYDIEFTKKRGERYTIGLLVSAGLTGIGTVQVTGRLKQIKLAAR